MPRTTHLWLLVLALALPGCHLIKVKAQANSVTHFNGKRTERQWKFEGTLEELPAALSGAYDLFAATADDLGKALKEVVKLPPPGQVRLRDLSPGLKQYEGADGVDFLNGPEAKKAGQKFQYVRIGVPQVDNFFRASTRLYATAWQTRQSLHRATELVGALSGEEIDVTGEIFNQMLSALKVKTTPTNQALKSKLERLRAAITILREVVPGLVGQVQELIATGQGLVTSAPGLITNPKVLLHVDKVKDGLVQSVEVIVQAGELLVGVVSDVFG